MAQNLSTASITDFFSVPVIAFLPFRSGRRIAAAGCPSEIAAILDCLAHLRLPVRIRLRLLIRRKLLVELAERHFLSAFLKDGEYRVTPRGAEAVSHVYVLPCRHHHRNDEPAVLAADHEVLVDDRHEVLAGVGGSVGDAVVLHLDDDLFERARLRYVRKHGVEDAFPLDVAHEDEHAAAFLQRSELLEHAVVHLLHEVIPAGAS